MRWSCNISKVCLCVSINIHISFIVCSDVIFLIYYDCFVSLLIVVSYSFIILLMMNVIHCLYYLFFTRWILNVFEMLHINVWISPFLFTTYVTRVISSPTSVLPSVPTSIFILNFLFFNVWAGKGVGGYKNCFHIYFWSSDLLQSNRIFFFFFSKTFDYVHMFTSRTWTERPLPPPHTHTH